MASATCSGAGKPIQLAADQVPERMTGKSVERKANDVDEQDERAEANAKMSAQVEGQNHVVPKESQEHYREIKEIAMQILQDKRERGFSFVTLVSAIAHRAGRWIKKECAVVSLAIVVAGCAKARRTAQDQKCRRQPRRQPVAMSINQRGAKRCEIRTCKTIEPGIEDPVFNLPESCFDPE